MRTAQWGALILMATLAASAPGQGRSADQLRELASQAKDSGDLQSEANYLCQAADQDGKKYGKKCARARGDVNRALSQFQADLGMGKAELQNKDFPGAMRDLGKITFGPSKPEAQQLMQQVRTGMGGVPADGDSQLALRQARDAYARGDFNAAETLAKHVQSPVLQSAANQLLTNINVYRDTMTQAQVLEHNGDLKGAEQKYKFAAGIQASGPGQPLEHLQAVQAAEASTQQAPGQGASGAETAQTSPTSKTQGLPKINYAAQIRNSLDAARKAEGEGDLKDALHHYNAALRLDMRQADAVAGKARVLAAMQGDPKEVQEGLNAGVEAFYASHFDEANEAFRTYLQAGGKQYAGAAHFYLGASLLTQVIFASPEDQSQIAAQRGQALQEFALARQLRYKPVESAVPPKILAQWTQTGSQE